MESHFAELISVVVAKYKELISSPLLAYPLNSAALDVPGVYVFYEVGVARYVGRAGNIHKRLRQHQANGSTHNKAAFAAGLAKRECKIKRVYHIRRASPEHFSNNAKFISAFAAAKVAIRGMQFRVVEEADPTRQALLEIYAATILKTDANDFDNS